MTDRQTDINGLASTADAMRMRCNKTYYLPYVANAIRGCIDTITRWQRLD